MTAERVIHERGGDRHVLATDVEIADTMLSRARGLMGRSSLPEEYALVMEMGHGLFGGTPRQAVHMLFVRVPLDVVWVADDEVQTVATLQPWRGFATGRGTRILELPAGNADGVEPGDTIRVE